MSLKSRLARLERAAGPDSRCPACPPIQFHTWRPGEPEPRPCCERCGRPVECILFVESIVGPDGEPDPEPAASPTLRPVRLPGTRQTADNARGEANQDEPR
jgi:hypothetical protein